MLKHPALNTLTTAIQLTIQQQNDLQKTCQTPERCKNVPYSSKYIKPRTNGSQSIIPEYLSTIPLVNPSQENISFPKFDLATNLLNQSISPNASPFANLIMKKERTVQEPKFQNSLSMPNIPIINVENLNVYSSAIDEKSLEDSNNYHHHHHHYHHDSFNYNKTQKITCDHQNSSTSSTQAAIVAAAAVALNLAKFLNQNEFKPSFFQSTNSDSPQKVAVVKTEPLKIEVPKQEAISLSSASSLSMKTIEMGT